jgi:small subunit ribosomal protein S20
MATHKSAAKAARQGETHRQANRRNSSRLRTQVKKLRQAIEAGQKEEAGSLLTPTLSLVDRSVHLGIIHRNAADRTKSRLTRHVNRLHAGA